MSPPKKSPPSPTPNTGSTNDLKKRVITCLHKLSDRDTLFLATTELETIAKTLTTHDAFSSFLTCLHNTESSSKSPVRKHCVNLLTLLSNSHGNSLSPHFTKMISTLTRRLRDSDSAVRAACIEATTAMSSQITKPPFSTISKPLIEMMMVEKDLSSQIGSALCLAAAIEAAPDPEVEQLKRVLPKLGKLVKSEGFKAKSALLSVVGSVVSVGGAKSKSVLDWLVPCLVEFLSCDDWSARKAAAEVLGKMAVLEKELAKHYKVVCLSCLENRRFDKVKAVRETMNRALQLWKEVPDVSVEVPVSSKSKSSPNDNAADESFPYSSNDSSEVSLRSPKPKKTVPANWSPPSVASSFVTTSRKQSAVNSINDNLETAMMHEMGHKKTSAWKTEMASPQDTDDNIKKLGSESGLEVNSGKCMTETKRVLFSSIRDDKLHKFGGLRSGYRVVPCDDDDSCYNVDGDLNIPTEEIFESSKDVEDLSLIRDQLIQIENQQSNLLDLLQRFIGSSQNGISSLESRVHGLEMALDEILYDLAPSSERLADVNSADNTCCKLPGAEFLSPKCWRRTGDQYSSSRFSTPMNIESLHASENIFGREAGTQTYNANVEKSQDHARSITRRSLGFYSSKMSSNIVQDDGQVEYPYRLAEAPWASCVIPMRTNRRLSA